MKIIIAAFLMMTSFIYAKTNIVVSILPQKTFVEKIGGDKVSVSAMVKPGSDPHSYEPKPSQMIAVSKADIYFPIGIEFEKAWLEKFKNQNKKMKIIEMTKGINYLQMPAHGHHEVEGEHAFEWAGAFSLKKHRYTWGFSKVDSKYADEKMKFLILPYNKKLSNSIEDLEKQANDIFNGSRFITKKDKDVLNKVNTLYEIEFNQKNDNTYVHIDIKKSGNYVVFTQHLPSEFEAKEHFLKDSNNKDIEAKYEEPEHEHEHHDHGGSKDPHVWTSPKNVKIIAKNIYTALVLKDTKNKDYYKKNYLTFLEEIASTDNKIREILLDLPSNSKFMVFHPSWQYFAKEYSLIQLVIEVEGKEPKPKTLKKIIDEARKENVKVIFAQEEFSDKSARVISQQLGIKLLKETPLASAWSQNLIKMAKAIVSEE